MIIAALLTTTKHGINLNAHQFLNALIILDSVKTMVVTRRGNVKIDMCRGGRVVGMVNLIYIHIQSDNVKFYNIAI